MAVAFDAKPTAWNSADGLCQQQAASVSTSASTGFSVGGTASCLVSVLLRQNASGVDPGALSSGTWNGVSRTGVLDSALSSSGNDRVRAAVAWWKASDMATGTNALTMAGPNTCDSYMSCASFTGVDTTTPVVTADNVTVNSGTTVTVTSTTDGATVAVWGTNGSTPTVNFNKIFAQAPLAPGAGASYQLAGTSNGHTYTGAGGTAPAGAGVHLQAATGGAAVIRLFFPIGMDGLGGGIMGSNRLH